MGMLGGALSMVCFGVSRTFLTLVIRWANIKYDPRSRLIYNPAIVAVSAGYLTGILVSRAVSLKPSLNRLIK